MEQNNPDYVSGCWHQIVFTSDMADTEVVHFAKAMKGAHESAGRLGKCVAYRHEDAKGNQSVFLSPVASTLAHSLPAYRSVLVSIGMIEPIEKNYSALTKMRIFE